MPIKMKNIKFNTDNQKTLFITQNFDKPYQK